MDLTTDKLRSLVRKWQTLIEATVDVKTTDGYFLRLFCISFTKKRPGQVKKTAYAQSSQVRGRLAARGAGGGGAGQGGEGVFSGNGAAAAVEGGPHADGACLMPASRGALAPSSRHPRALPSLPPPLSLPHLPSPPAPSPALPPLRSAPSGARWLRS